jgi:hypothetical protein
MIYLLIYLSGFVVSYYLLRRYNKKLGGYTWRDVIYQVKISLFSWLSVIAFIAVIINEKVKLPKLNSKPPEWL